jgi:AbiV family abortive infection protein
MAGKRERALTQYWGDLAADGIAVGINVARRNARRLADDAKALLDLGRLPSATALAILSLEESGKPLVLRRIALASDAANLKEAWRDFRRHTVKNSHSILPDIVRGGGRSLEDFRPAVEGGEHSQMLDAVKQIALYADCLGTGGNWSDPDVVIDRSLAEEMVGLADVMAQGPTVSVREIQLWIEHVGPHYGSADMARSVVAFQAALQAEGLTDTSAEQLAAFMGELIDGNSAT